MSKELEWVDPEDLIIVGIDTDDDQEHPLYDERAFYPLDENLVRNIMVYGVIQPVTVRKEAGQRYVVTGRQRVKAAREAAKRQRNTGTYVLKVPTRPAAVEDRLIAGIVVSENEQRQDDTPAVKAFKAARMMTFGADLTEVALAFGRSEVTIRNWLTFVKADPRIHEAVTVGEISMQSGVELARLPRADQVDSLEKLVQQAAGNRRVSDTDVRELRQELAETAEEVPPGTKPKRAKTPRLRRTRQSGIKRTWLRKALETEAAQALNEDQRALLRWIAFGVADSDTWFTEFQQAADLELTK